MNSVFGQEDVIRIGDTLTQQIEADLAAIYPNGPTLFQRYRYLEEKARAKENNANFALQNLARDARAAYEMNTSPEERARDATSELAQGNASLAALLRQPNPDPTLLASFRSEVAYLQSRADAASAALAAARAREAEIRKLPRPTGVPATRPTRDEPARGTTAGAKGTLGTIALLASPLALAGALVWWRSR